MFQREKILIVLVAILFALNSCNKVKTKDVNNTNNFDEISDDWDVISQADDNIELQDISGGDSSIDKLTFKRI